MKIKQVDITLQYKNCIVRRAYGSDHFCTELSKQRSKTGMEITFGLKKNELVAQGEDGKDI